MYKGLLLCLSVHLLTDALASNMNFCIHGLSPTDLGTFLLLRQHQVNYL